MTDETMKAGPELDAKLCHLLEPKPERRPSFINSRTTRNEITYVVSTGGFWECAISNLWAEGDGVPDWQPIPVSTDWGAAGKVSDAMRDKCARADIMCFRPNNIFGGQLRTTVRFLFTTNPTIIEETGDTFPHALALAAVEALEKRAEATP